MISENNNVVFCLDSKQRIQVESKSNKFNYLGRLIKANLNIRNYDVLDVLKTAVSSNNLEDGKAKKLYESAGKKLNMTSEQVRKLVKVLRLAQDGGQYESKLQKISQAFNIRALKALKTLEGHFEKQSSGSKVLKQMMDRITVHAKWNAIGLDGELVNRHFEEVQFLCQTRLIYSIIGYQNTTASGLLDHGIKEEIDPISNKSQLLMKKQGQWVPVRQIKEEFSWDSKEHVLASKTNQHERWNYFSEGLVPIDRFYHHSVAHEEAYPKNNANLYPVAKLSSEEMDLVVKQAKKFSAVAQNAEQGGKDLNCVLQFVSHPRFFGESELLKNMNSQIPVHCGIRVLLSDGSVYSTGFGSALEEDVYNEGLRKYLGTINGQPTIMDYEEFRPHEGRIVTNIPVDSKKAEMILKRLNTYRKDSIRFNILRQNCMVLGTRVLSMAGVNLNIRISFNAMLCRALPNLESIPVVGKTLKDLKGRITKVTTFISSKIPALAKKALSFLGEVLLYLPCQLNILMRNLLILSFGALVASPEREKGDKGDKDEIEQFEDSEFDDFNKLWNGLFDSKASDIQHSSIFINWQLQQQSTDVHRYSGKPSMNLLPPSGEEAQSYSHQKKESLQDIYKYSTAVYS